MKVARKRVARTLHPKNSNAGQNRHPSKLVTPGRWKPGRKGFRSDSSYPRAESVVR